MIFRARWRQFDPAQRLPPHLDPRTHKPVGEFLELFLGGLGQP